MKELWRPSFLYCLKLFNVEEDAFAGALLSCLNGCFQKIIWDINRLVKTVRWLSRDIRVRFPHIVEAIFSSKENSWSDLLTDTVAGTEVLIYPYFYSAEFMTIALMRYTVEGGSSRCEDSSAADVYIHAVSLEFIP